MAQASLAELKAITAEHVNNFDAQGRTAVKGANKKANKALEQSKDPFNRPSPGLVKRLAAEARNDAKRRNFQDEAGPSDAQRREIMLAKAKKYEAMRRGDYSGFTEKELAEGVIDFDRKWEDHDSDVDESETLPLEDPLEQVEYVDEMGRTRIGTRQEARAAAAFRSDDSAPEPDENGNDTAYAEVLRSNVIHGDQRQFPVYEPDPEKLKEKWRAAEEESRPQHYDSTREVRAKGAAAYDLSHDPATRREQLAALSAQRKATESARKEAGPESAAQQAKRRKIEERRALIESKRRKMMGEEAVEEKRDEKRRAEADRLLEGLAREWQ